MRYVQLRAFHNVATMGGFSRAAEAMNLTQPAVSDQVRRLEQGYDIRLFDRRTKQITLTAAGDSLLAITHRMFESEAEALELLSAQRARHAGVLRIVADSAHHLLQVLAAFQARHPAVRIKLRAGNSQVVLEQLHSYEADIGVLGENPQERGLEVVELGATPIVACVARGSALASRDALTLEDLAAQPLVLREAGSKTRAKLMAAATARGVTLTPAIEAEGREAVREIVAAGGGVGFISRAEFGQDARLVAIPITPADGLDMQEALICLSHRSQSRLVRAFFDLVAEALPGS